MPAAELHHVGGTGGHCKGDLGHVGRGSTTIVSTGDTGSIGIGAAVVNDQHAVGVSSGLSAGADGGIPAAAGGVGEPGVVRHVAITSGCATGGTAAGVVGVSAFTDGHGSTTDVRIADQRDIEGSGSTGSLPAAELHHVGGAGGHCKGDLGHVGRGSTTIVSTGDTGSIGIGAAVVNDQHAVGVSSGLSAGADGGIPAAAGGVGEPGVVRHVAITSGCATGGTGAGVVGMGAFTYGSSRRTVVLCIRGGTDEYDRKDRSDSHIETRNTHGKAFLLTLSSISAAKWRPITKNSGEQNL